MNLGDASTASLSKRMSSMPDQLTPEGYAQAGGERCPACLGKDLVRRHYDQSGPGRVTRTWRCSKCAATWTAVYELTGYEGLTTPGDTLAQLLEQD